MRGWGGGSQCKAGEETRGRRASPSGTGPGVAARAELKRPCVLGTKLSTMPPKMRKCFTRKKRQRPRAHDTVKIARACHEGKATKRAAEASARQERQKRGKQRTKKAISKVSQRAKQKRVKQLVEAVRGNFPPNTDDRVIGEELIYAGAAFQNRVEQTRADPNVPAVTVETACKAKLAAGLTELEYLAFRKELKKEVSLPSMQKVRDECDRRLKPLNIFMETHGDFYLFGVGDIRRAAQTILESFLKELRDKEDCRYKDTGSQKDVTCEFVLSWDGTQGPDGAAWNLAMIRLVRFQHTVPQNANSPDRILPILFATTSESRSANTVVTHLHRAKEELEGRPILVENNRRMKVKVTLSADYK